MSFRPDRNIPAKKESEPPKPAHTVSGWVFYLISAVAIVAIIVAGVGGCEAWAQELPPPATTLADGTNTLAGSVKPTSISEVAECIISLAKVLPVAEAKQTCLSAQKEDI